ncbi:MAG: tRNA (adenosine(37)-N6)-dimethylallyltransferase MiaA [Gammaproteobacteria bacterium]|nr:tRNA (adenosine(37)-N6)-dimethylallyltransferase MiaA [Gammaproteobacteria bacterium]
MSKDKSTVICIMGPTAAGKTDLAVELLEHLSAEIISVDSALIYKGMKIGTAMPDDATLARAPHRLINFLDPVEPYSAARFREDALNEIEDVLAKGRIPLLVGGTMLYFRALLQGLSDLPAADESIRKNLEEEMATHGLAAMHARLAQIDPEAAARIHPNDPQRTQRALEVFEATGISMTEWYRRGTDTDPFPYQCIKMALIPGDRARLHERIAKRFHLMLEQGLVDEVRGLYERGDLNLDKPSMRAVGYRQVWEYLEGNYSYEQMVEKGIVATRQLAKRQLTWLRSEQNTHILDPFEGKLTEQALKTLEKAPI